jgi:hypothetical protein
MGSWASLLVNNTGFLGDEDEFSGAVKFNARTLFFLVYN